ncbi:hypothetical protein GB881_15200 [Georgenia subflava]|uniref:Uncharacterized protein n=1 Tax=Georgenia subflava TaxID=1622177 RepID=A0A6N7EQE9_9MICO|nr:hypothetical protein [Georgenia subflava]
MSQTAKLHLGLCAHVNDTPNLGSGNGKACFRNEAGYSHMNDRGKRVSDLVRRVSALERSVEVRAMITAYGEACDEGPYQIAGLEKYWSRNARFASNGDEHVGHDDIAAFFKQLVAPFTLHYFTNIRVTGLGDDTVQVHCYGWETPVIGTASAVGAFTHDVALATDWQQKWRWNEWQQSVHFISPHDRGWAPATRVIDQTSTGELPTAEE